MRRATGTVASRDGTTIAFDRRGTGPPLVLVDGALGDRSSHAPLADALAPQLTVHTYDRRGRNGSGDTSPYAVQREVEDLAAVIAAAGGSAYVFGMSSGGVLALDAAASGLAITRLAVYEPPFIVDGSRPPVPADYLPRLEGLIAAGRRDDAVALFLTTVVGMPAAAVAPMRHEPTWPALVAVAHTLAYDGAVMGDTMSGRPLPAQRWAAVTMPTLVVDGGASEPYVHTGAAALAALLPDARRRTLAGQTHDVAPELLAPVLAELFDAADPDPYLTGGEP